MALFHCIFQKIPEEDFRFYRIALNINIRRTLNIDGNTVVEFHLQCLRNFLNDTCQIYSSLSCHGLSRVVANFVDDLRSTL